jgi:prolyl-tRNA synthetase
VAFERIFERCGIRVIAVEASAGEMGGREPREYMALSQAGEDTLAICPSCGYAANLEVAVSSQQSAGQSAAGWERATEVATPDCKTIAELAVFLGIPESATAKAVFFDTPERGLLFAVIRGDLDVNEAKLRAAASVSALAPASPEQIAAAGAVAGYASPVGLSVADARAATTDQGSNKAGRGPVVVIADRSVVSAGPLAAGANRAGYHLCNVVYGRDWHATQVADIATVRAGDPCIQCGTALTLERGIEIGHIFKLGTRFTQALGASYLDQDGTAKPIVMGSYGIGVERLMQAIV